MKAAVIAPTPHLELSDEGDYYFVLGHRAMTDEKYLQYYVDNVAQKKILLDNGAFELDTSIPTDVLLDMAKILNADEVVAPDFPMHGEESYNMAKDFLSVVPKGMQIIVLPHGRDVPEFIKYYNRVLARLSADVIGFSVLFHKHTGLRPHLIRYLQQNDMFAYDTEHHLFGLDSLAELVLINNIRSVDCSLPISIAKAGYQLMFMVNPPEHKRVDDTDVLSEKEYDQALENIETYLKVAHKVM